MPETCKAKYRWTREQLTIAMRHHQATKLRRGVVLLMKIFSIILLSFIGIVLLAWILHPPRSTPPGAFLLLIIFCFYLLMFDRVNAWSWGRRFGKRPDADMEVEWQFANKPRVGNRKVWGLGLQFLFVLMAPAAAYLSSV